MWIIRGTKAAWSVIDHVGFKAPFSLILNLPCDISVSSSQPILELTRDHRGERRQSEVQKKSDIQRQVQKYREVLVWYLALEILIPSEIIKYKLGVGRPKVNRVRELIWDIHMGIMPKTLHLFCQRKRSL